MDEIDLRDQQATAEIARNSETDPESGGSLGVEPVEESDLAGQAELIEPELGAPSLSAALEALLLLADDPLTPAELGLVCHESATEVESVLHDLAAQYREDARGFELREVDSKWRFYTSVDCADLVARYVTDGRQAKLSNAALETLAIIAYRQPVGRAHVASVRGVNADGVIRTLVQRGLVAEVSEDPSTGAMLFGTTTHFLDRMGLASVSELPPIADHLPELSSLDDFVD